jgi:subtilisin family serine protease
MPDDTPRRPVADNFARRFAPPELYDPKKRREWKLGRRDEDRGPYVIELNLQHIEGLPGAIASLEMCLAALNGDDSAPPPPDRISKTYVRCLLTVDEWQRLLHEDGRRATEQAKKAAKEAQSVDNPLTASESGQTLDSMRYRAIYKLWPDFPIQSQIYQSVATIKSDAAFKSFGAAGAGIVWAVIDSGIDQNHPHFGDARVVRDHTLLSPEVRDLHRCFVDSESTFADIPVLAPAPKDPDGLERPATNAPQQEYNDYLEKRKKLIEEHRRLALTDDFGHGTHVAGIIAGRGKAGTEIRLLERTDEVGSKGELKRGQFELTGTLPPDQVRGMAPSCRLISLRVLDGNGEGRSSDVIRALDYVREKLNDNPKLLRVHGVNLSVGYEFDPEMFACGQSPICAEVNRLVQSGVVVVAAAGNTGFGTVAASVRPTKVGLSNTINDPGNAELAITVGATHRDSPYTYGVSYFSSKGPTGDGRVKPDVVAPGERITSCGAGKRLRKAIDSAGLQAIDGSAYYMEDSGTSMAAPHVSGAVAAFLSIRREFIGKPLDVKRIFLSTASPLGRERYFEGHGLIDLIRAIQSV